MTTWSKSTSPNCHLDVNRVISIAHWYALGAFFRRNGMFRNLYRQSGDTNDVLCSPCHQSQFFSVYSWRLKSGVCKYSLASPDILPFVESDTYPWRWQCSAFCSRYKSVVIRPCLEQIWSAMSVMTEKALEFSRRALVDLHLLELACSRSSIVKVGAGRL